MFCFSMYLQHELALDAMNFISQKKFSNFAFSYEKQSIQHYISLKV